MISLLPAVRTSDTTGGRSSARATGHAPWPDTFVFTIWVRLQPERVALPVGEAR